MELIMTRLGPLLCAPAPSPQERKWESGVRRLLLPGLMLSIIVQKSRYLARRQTQQRWIDALLPSFSRANTWGNDDFDPQLGLAEGINYQESSGSSSSLGPTSVSGDFLREMFDGVLNMAVPKSKVSPSRKKMKHTRYFPKKVNWFTCPRCGEPKRPHRICTTYKEICAMRERDWRALKSREGQEKNAPEEEKLGVKQES